MKPSSAHAQALADLRSNLHELSNYFTSIYLTLELCGSPRNLTEEDYTLIQEQIESAVKKLRESREHIAILEKAAKEEGIKPALKVMQKEEDNVA